MGSPNHGGGIQRVALTALPQISITFGSGVGLFAFTPCQPRRRCVVTADQATDDAASAAVQDVGYRSSSY